MVRHYGVFEFNDDVTPEQIQECFDEMLKMVGEIPGLLSMEWGEYQSDEGLGDGYTHGFMMTFDSLESRDAYLPHPVHMERVNLVQPRSKRLVVFDFDVKPEQTASI